MDVLWRNLPYLLSGAVQTLWLSAVTIVLGTLLGLVLGFAAVAGPAAIRAVITAYIFVLRGIPVLVVMFVAYYAIPAMGIRAPSTVAVTLALVLYAAAFIAEIVRGSLVAVSRGQSEAAASLGMRRLKILFDIVLPQALRPALAPWLNTCIVMIKSTAYVAVVGVWELTYAAREVVERTLAAVEIFSGAMMIYFVICYPLSLVARQFEARATVAH